MGIDRMVVGDSHNEPNTGKVCRSYPCSSVQLTFFIQVFDHVYKLAIVFKSFNHTCALPKLQVVALIEQVRHCGLLVMSKFKIPWSYFTTVITLY